MVGRALITTGRTPGPGLDLILVGLSRLRVVLGLTRLLKLRLGLGPVGLARLGLPRVGLP